LKNNEITVYPESWRRETIRWLENIHDWNVSRQLWWGHRIPVWYGPDGEVVASKQSPGEGWEQDVDILDTWFSSGLWPFATLGWPEEGEDLAYFYPTTLLSTAREIMYLWVARMIMMGLRFRDEVPFRKVNVHSIVLAEDGTKMSKSKGNTINPLDLFDQYGTDAVRFGLLYQSSTQDFAYSYERAEMGRAFVTKLWNATRFVLSYPEADESRDLSPSDRWILSEFNRTVRDYDAFLEECEFSEAMRRIYSFAWNQFADWYIEIAKATPSPATPRVLREVFHGILRLLHPVMPFATEEMANVMGEDGLLASSRFPEYDPALEDEEADDSLDRTKECVRAIRAVRSDLQIEGEILAKIVGTHGREEKVEAVIIERLAQTDLSGDPSRLADYSVVAKDVSISFWLRDDQRHAALRRLRDNLDQHQAEVDRAVRKLANEKFVERAPANIVAAEREKMSINEAEVNRLTSLLSVVDQ
jgi:valyl-tRNA synthetase